MTASVLNRFMSQPRQLFIADAIGAALSAVLLGVVLVAYEDFFGVPRSALYVLASFPFIFAIYDVWCFLFVSGDVKLYLKIIAFANFAYCCLSMTMALWHRDSLTVFGWIYVFVEVLLVLVVAWVEWSVSVSRSA